MKKQIISILTIWSFAVICASPAFSDELETLAGKWISQSTNEDGQRYTQQMVHFHLKNAQSWGNERTGVDLAAQIDPAFVIDTTACP